MKRSNRKAQDFSKTPPGTGKARRTPGRRAEPLGEVQPTVGRPRDGVVCQLTAARG